jgi:hypothetical protein
MTQLPSGVDLLIQHSASIAFLLDPVPRTYKGTPEEYFYFYLVLALLASTVLLVGMIIWFIVWVFSKRPAGGWQIRAKSWNSHHVYRTNEL